MRRSLQGIWLATVFAAVIVLSGCGDRTPAKAPSEPVPEASAPPAPAPAPPAPAAPPSPALTPSAAEFERLETGWAEILARKDGAALDRLIAPEFLVTGVGSSVGDPVGGRSEWLQAVDKYPWPRHQVSDVRIALAAPETVVVKCVWSGNYPPESLTPQGGLVQLLITDVWTLRDGEWKVVARHTSLPRAE